MLRGKNRGTFRGKNPKLDPRVAGVIVPRVGEGRRCDSDAAAQAGRGCGMSKSHRRPQCLKPGDPVVLEGPYGTFTLDRAQSQQIWISGGIGLTPFVAWLEDLVANPDVVAKDYLAHCGLDWHPECLEFYKTDHTATTASMIQVRRPIFKDSLGKWQRFEPYIGPLATLVSDADETKVKTAQKSSRNAVAA